MRYEVVFEGVIRRSGAEDAVVPPDEFKAWIHAITAELMKLGAKTPVIGGTTEDGTLEIRVVVDGDAVDGDLAMGLGGGQIRTAAHAAGLATPGWNPPRWISVYAIPESTHEIPDDASALAGMSA